MLSSVHKCVRGSAAILGRKLFSTRAVKMAGDTYTLKYFNFRVLGEPIRWQFALAGVPFKDERLPRDNWDTGNKNVLGWGRLPILVINEKTEISQSTAISRYLAHKFGLMPKDPLNQTRCDELVDNLQDLRLLWRPYVRESDPAKKKVLAKEMTDLHFPFYLPKVEAFLKTFGGPEGYAVGNELTWADLYLANFMEIWSHNHGKELLQPFPRIKANMDKILSIPQIKEWNIVRPPSNF